MERKGEVYYKNQPVGKIVETSTGGTQFTYNDDCSQSIGCALPRAEKVFIWQQGLHPFFQNLTSEGELRREQQKSAHLKRGDNLGLVLNFGEDCIGAVGVVSTEKNVFQDKVESIVHGNKMSGLPGVQPKFLVYKKGQEYFKANQSHKVTYIAKLNNAALGLDNLVRNEAVSLRFAKDILGNKAVTNYMPTILPENDESALIIERFDRSKIGEKLRMEDFAQILNKPSKDKYDASYEDIASAIQQYSKQPIIDLDRFFRQVLLTIIVGNCDAHLKNFSLIEQGDGLILSPAYDIINTLLYPEKNYDFNIGLAICGDKPNITKIDGKLVREFGRNINLNERTIQLALDDIERRISKSKVLDSHPAAGLEDFNNRYKGIIEAACIKIFEE
jgi:serine/threonine-protein kinase HipA